MPTPDARVLAFYFGLPEYRAKTDPSIPEMETGFFRPTSARPLGFAAHFADKFNGNSRRLVVATHRRVH